MQQATIQWGEHKITPFQEILLRYITENNLTCGVSADDVRHLVNGEILTARSLLHRLAEKKLLKKRVIKQKGVWDGQKTTRRLALFFPLQKSE